MDIKNLIKLKGYTLERVAETMNPPVSVGSISKTISGNPTVGTLRKIADIIGCDIADFFADEKREESPEQYSLPEAPPEPTPQNSSSDRQLVKDLMKAKGMSLSELSKRIGTDRKLLNSLLCGEVSNDAMDSYLRKCLNILNGTDESDNFVALISDGDNHHRFNSKQELVNWALSQS